MSGNKIVETAFEFKGAVVAMTDDSTEVHAGPAIVRGFHVITALSAQACPIKDGTTQKWTIPASTPAGTWIIGGDVAVESLTVDPDNAASAGSVLVVYKPRVP